ncbi:transcriptional regulator [Iodidimonas gelatinilytica]|uniref:Transcriptional regulator n=2 Tax=Iodidimonas TaxID=2066486 RepID=A0A5A7MVR0_9PROT|nr:MULTISPECIES: metalloregulator ArsR/SmtB family transcription factor [Iodidimonas]GEQ96588.1 transcriptional regulator [Iodidimonas gelatinilytica]GER00093.1 transcriptional regulator [Iodidimonas gelatinilytica]GER06620.1 transcriptional regulator [Kordiimonadales bacterium JCM 17843]GGO05484.1 transcriptional regulator [Iodidimonas muriae]
MTTPSLPTTACVDRLKLLADPTRLAIVRLLTDGPMIVKDINEHLAMEQNLLSHHLKVLREGGLLESERQGKAVAYRLTKGVHNATEGDAIDLGCCKLSF